MHYHLPLAILVAQIHEGLSNAVINAGGIPTEFCEDLNQHCLMWAEKGECSKNPAFMSEACRASCFLCQSNSCYDQYDDCERWASAGECAKNEAFMLAQCAFACRTCFVNQTAACRRHSASTPAAVEGTIDRLLEAVLHGPLATRVLHRDPWLIAFDSFLSSEEADALVLAAGHHFEDSRFLGDEDVANKGLERNRTSMTSWCNVPSCLEDSTIINVHQRISDVLGVPWRNAEHLQLLRYEEGQFYRVHHDQISPLDSAWGPRLFTFFMYLSDVKNGGETSFPAMGNISIAPRKGNAILWPSVLPSNPDVTDERTVHEALPVISGVKYAANFWIHAYDFQTFHARGCDNRNYLQDRTLTKRRLL